jgi:hypothetical protein
MRRHCRARPGASGAGAGAIGAVIGARRKHVLRSRGCTAAYDRAVVVPGEVISYLDMCREEGVNLQRGMNYRSGGRPSVILMSLRPGAPYDDRVEEDGRVLIYEGHDRPQTRGGPDPKTLDQPERGPGGTLTQNGLFQQAASRHRELGTPAEHVRVYEKMRTGIWTFNGTFRLVDAWREESNVRTVF